MRRKYSIGLGIGLIAIIYGKLASYSGGFFSTGYTGSPGDNGMSCVSCHAGSPVTSTQGAITTNIPQAGYVPGQSYTVTVTAQHPTFNVFGFMLTAETSTGAKAGTWSILNATETQLTAGGNYVSHTSSGIFGSSNSKSWTVQWTAPTPGVGPVTFYVAINRANGNSTTSGDHIQIASLQVMQYTPPPPPPVCVKIDTVLDERCLNGCNGSIQASATGGIPPITLSITGNSFTNLCGGQYWVIATDSIGQTDSVLVQVKNGSNPPIPDIHYDQAYSLLYTTAKAQGYEWYYFGQAIPNSNNDTLSLTGMQAGEYSVEISDSLSCRSMSQVLSIIFGNIAEGNAYRCVVYPNPVLSGDWLFIKYEGGPATIQILSIEGRLVLSDKIYHGIHSINTHTIAPGVYLLFLKSSKGDLRTVKFLVK